MRAIPKPCGHVIDLRYREQLLVDQLERIDTLLKLDVVGGQLGLGGRRQATMSRGSHQVESKPSPPPGRPVLSGTAASSAQNWAHQQKMRCATLVPLCVRVTLHDSVGTLPAYLKFLPNAENLSIIAMLLPRGNVCDSVLSR
jgi:hypothetical protein